MTLILINKILHQVSFIFMITIRTTCLYIRPSKKQTPSNDWNKTVSGKCLPTKSLYSIWFSCTTLIISICVLMSTITWIRVATA